MKDFRQLKVWEKAHQVALAIYKATKEFPKEELYGLTSQIRRASMSIPTNISEGCGRNIDLGFLNKIQYDLLNIDVTEVKRMLATLLKTLRADR
jgi:hypothetical protein